MTTKSGEGDTMVASRYRAVWVACGISCLLLVVVSSFDFLIFHALAELFTVIVAMLLAVIGCAAYRFVRNGFLTLLAGGYFWVGMTDLIHLLAYKGMGIFPDPSPNHATQLWLVARFIEASVLLLAPSFLTRDLRRRVVFTVLGTGTVAAIAAIFTHTFPVAYIEGSGLTPFKVVSEYVIIVMLGAALWQMSAARSVAGDFVGRLVIASIALAMVQELVFTLYVGVYDLPSVLGHLLKFVSFTLILVAIVEMTIVTPYDALLRLRAELEQRVQERTLDLERANKAKSAFLADMSHELRTPLNAILGFSEVIGRQVMGPVANAKYVEYADDIHGSARHLLGLVNDLLDVSKIEAGKYQLEIERLPVAGVLKESVTLLRQQTAQKEIVLDVQSADGEVLADRRALKQILINLVANAVKFTPPGGRITVGSADCGSCRSVFVEDTGVGMTDEEARRAFEPFVQIERKDFRAKEGTGLGLTIAKSLTELQGGHLWIATEKGRGTRITVCMPTGLGPGMPEVCPSCGQAC